MGLSISKKSFNILLYNEKMFEYDAEFSVLGGKAVRKLNEIVFSRGLEMYRYTGAEFTFCPIYLERNWQQTLDDGFSPPFLVIMARVTPLIRSIGPQCDVMISFR